MCGRTCLSLDPKSVACACKYKAAQPPSSVLASEKLADKKQTDAENVEYLKPEWRPEYNCGRKFIPSYNIAPSDITLALVSAEFFGDDGQNRVLVPMVFGLIPFWHKGDYRRHGLPTQNCRRENLMKSQLFRVPFLQGQRCVILCEGYYEWQTLKATISSERHPYFVYMPQVDGVSIHNKSSWNVENVNLLKMAGIFDIWEDDCNKMFSCSVVTQESRSNMYWLHTRSPVILDTDNDVRNWLDYKSINAEGALALLPAPPKLKWHRVSKTVNNSRNKCNECNTPFDECTAAKSLNSSKSIMYKWLNKGKPDHDQKPTSLKVQRNTEINNKKNSENDKQITSKRQKYA